jgi:hypothetical protein
MSIDFIVTIPVADVPAELPNPSVLMAQWTDGVPKQAYLYTADDISAWPIAAGVTGAWDTATGLQNGQTYDIGNNVIGTPNFPVTSDYATFIRPLGNFNGEATGLLDSLRWAGHSEPKFLADDNRYTPTESPFTLQITRIDNGSTALPWDNGTTYEMGDFVTSGGLWQSVQDSNTGNTPFGGSPWWFFVNQSGPWMWRVDMISDDPQRDITARAIGVYSDPAATNFLYTTGAFVDDGSGNFFTETPPGNRTATAEPVYFALLLGAGQEGIFQLQALEDGADAEALFWSADQP